jgi:hypothetical protein
VLDVAQGNYYQHELRLFHSLRGQLHKGEIVVYDRAGGHFVLAASLRQQHVDLISRVLNRHIDGRRRHQRLGQRDTLLRTLAQDLVPERPGRREPRAVKRRPKPYRLLNKPRHQFREDGRRAYCKSTSYN